MRKSAQLQALVLADGTAEGPVRATNDMLSFWGGYDPASGEVIDRRHSLSGEILTGTIFVMPHGKGSSTGSPVLLDALMQGNAPAAIILSSVDEIIALGSVVAEEFFGTSMPIAVLDPESFTIAQRGARISIEPGGLVSVFNEEEA